MHPHLAPHLHSDCKDLIDALHTCHQEHPYGKYFGKCNDAKLKMMKCLEEESSKRRRQNRTLALANAESAKRLKESLKSQ